MKNYTTTSSPTTQLWKSSSVPLTTIACGECTKALSSFRSFSACRNQYKKKKKYIRRMNFEFSHRYYKFQQWLIQSYKPYVTLSHSPSMTWLRNLVAEGCSKRHPDSCMRRSTVWLQERYSVKKPDQFHPHKYTACHDNSLPYFKVTSIKQENDDQIQTLVQEDDLSCLRYVKSYLYLKQVVKELESFAEVP